MPTFTIRCPVCDTLNDIETDDPTVPWSCSGCSAEPFTSLPTDEVTGELLPPEREVY